MVLVPRDGGSGRAWTAALPLARTLHRGDAEPQSVGDTLPFYQSHRPHRSLLIHCGEIQPGVVSRFPQRKLSFLCCVRPLTRLYPITQNKRAAVFTGGTSVAPFPDSPCFLQPRGPLPECMASTHWPGCRLVPEAPECPLCHSLRTQRYFLSPANLLGSLLRVSSLSLSLSPS